jgi:uncharacterized protein YciI
MLYVLFFEDDDTHADKRAQYMTEHLAFLVRNAKCILAAGPLKDAHKSDPAGGLWLIEANDLSKVETLIKEDPFWPTGLRKSIKILEWTRVFAEGKKLI